MRQIDGKYKTDGNLTKLNNTPLPKDEPPILFRGHDKLLPQLLIQYKAMCQKAGSPEAHLELVEERIQAIKAWQESNPVLVKIPD